MHAPPLVVIEDPENQHLGDPGNVKQSRTIANGMLSGLVIDLLGHIQVRLMPALLTPAAARLKREIRKIIAPFDTGTDSR